MGKLLDRCIELRHDAEGDYGCSHAVFIPVAEKYGLDKETAYKIAAHLRGGMRTAHICGAVTGAVLALGLADAPKEAAVELQRRLNAAHDNDLMCRSLLARNHAAGKDKHEHCNEMCYECMRIVEELIGD